MFLLEVYDFHGTCANSVDVIFIKNMPVYKKYQVWLTWNFKEMSRGLLSLPMNISVKACCENLRNAPFFYFRIKQIIKTLI